MKIALTLSIAGILTTPFVLPLTAAESALTNDQQRASYAIGLNVGNNIKRFTYEVDLDAVFKGIRDFLSGEITMTPEDAQMAISNYQHSAQQVVGERNRAQGEAFLAANKQKEGVRILPVTLEDGATAELQYEILEEGNGPVPAPSDTVRVHYRGTLIDGTEFDNSLTRNESVQFPVNRVIRGWAEGLMQMKAGSKWRLFIPPTLAFGAQAQGGVTPHSTLILEVELLEVQKPPAPAALPQVQAPAPSPRPPQQVTSDIVGVQGTNIQIIRAQDLIRTNTNAAPR